MKIIYNFFSNKERLKEVHDITLLLLQQEYNLGERIIFNSGLIEVPRIASRRFIYISNIHQINTHLIGTTVDIINFYGIEIPDDLKVMITPNFRDFKVNINFID